MGKIVDGIYYNSNNLPTHRGIVKIDDDLYYAEKNGVIVKDRDKIVHKDMAHGLVERGTYYFDKDGKLVPESFLKPHKKKKSIFKLSRKNTNAKTSREKARITKIIKIVATFFAIFLVFSLAIKPDLFGLKKDLFDLSDYSSQQIKVDLPEFKEKVYLCSSSLKQFYDGEITLEQACNIQSSAYSPFVFNYKLPENYKGTLNISENKDYSDSDKFTLSHENTKVEVDNLKTNTKYYYKVIITNEKGKEEVTKGTFVTADTNRFICIPGIYNTRDIGGYDTVYNKKIKQGLLIRGTEIDGLVESKYFLENKEDVKRFGFVCDLDLRNKELISVNYKSRLGDNVTHKFYNSPQYGEIFNIVNANNLKQIFSDLADKNNYPMYLHCTYGADRTGTIVFLLQGLLGVSEEDMKNEYRLTGFFSKGYINGTNLNSIYGGIEGVNGNTINEKIENYLIDTVGITKQQVESIRNIFLN